MPRNCIEVEFHRPQCGVKIAASSQWYHRPTEAQLKKLRETLQTIHLPDCRYPGDKPEKKNRAA